MDAPISARILQRLWPKSGPALPRDVVEKLDDVQGMV
jgi:hypothetical protein